ncbi:MAG: aldose 1-epimerase [Maribacter sp.]|nr:aldose 1-epimerase [Maribacter sp.]
MEKLVSLDSYVQIDGGELVGFKVGENELIHQKGSPGWRNSDTEMFPIIGPTSESDFQVHTPRGAAVQDQHGLLRELHYQLVSQTDTEVLFRKTYSAGTLVPNSKFPEKSKAKTVFWPYDFQFEKRFKLDEECLKITFKISGEKDMPFMLGYHPAFKLSTKNPVVITQKKTINLDQVLAVGSKALLVADCNEIALNDTARLRITTTGFRHFMLWTEVPNMICIEPITFYPYAVPQENLGQGFQFLHQKEIAFTVNLTLLSKQGKL